MSLSLSNLQYENNYVRCKTVRNIPKIETVGFFQEALEADKEFKTFYWVARELARNGLIEYIDEILSNNEWTRYILKNGLTQRGRQAH